MAYGLIECILEIIITFGTFFLFRMNILIVGSGGREHCLATILAESSRVARIFIAPGTVK